MVAVAQPVHGHAVQALFWIGVLAFFGLAINLSLDVGSYKSFVNVLQLLAVIQILWCVGRYRRVPREVGWLAVVPGVFLLCDLLAPAGVSDKYAVRNLFAAFALATLIATTPRFWPEQWLAYTRQALLAVLVVATTVQLVAVFVFGQPFGLHRNPHFLSLQGIVTVPAALYFARSAPRWPQALAVMTAAGALALIAVTGSTIGALSIFVAALAGICCYRPRLTTILVCAGVLLLGAAFVATQDHRSVVPEMRDIVDGSNALVQDERSVIWADAWHKQLDSNGVQWLVGHGLGGFAENFGEYSRLEAQQRFVFPHNFLLEVLYNSGLVGLLAFCAALLALLWRLWQAARRGAGSAPLLAALFCGVLVFTFLTLPLLARYSVYTLAICAALVLASTSGNPRRA